MPSLPEFAALDAYRLDQDWTFLQLAEAMADAGCAIPPRTLHYLLKRAPRSARPLDRTLHKIRKYLQYVETARKAGRRPVEARA